jgi:hypothetical protein
MTRCYLARNVLLVLLLFCALSFAGCAGHKAPELASAPEAVPAFKGQYSLMQRARLFMPKLSMTQSFTVAATVSMPEKKARVVGISGPGLTFFDVEINGNADIVHYMHPGFGRIPGIEKQLFWSVRLVLINALSQKVLGHDQFCPKSTMGKTVNRQVAIGNGHNIEYCVSAEGRILTAQETLNKKAIWTLAFDNYEGLWPKNIQLEHDREAFSLEITTYSIKKER